MIKRKDFSNNQEFMNYNKSVIHDNYFVFYASLTSMLAPSTQIPSGHYIRIDKAYLQQVLDQQQLKLGYVCRLKVGIKAAATGNRPRHKVFMKRSCEEPGGSR